MTKWLDRLWVAASVAFVIAVISWAMAGWVG